MIIYLIRFDSKLNCMGEIMFHEICIYEAKIEKQEEIEQLMKEVKEFYKKQKGVIEVYYIKRNHRQKDFNAVKAGEPPVELTRYVGKVTYMLHWILDNKEIHAKISKLGIEKYYKRWTQCLTTMPKILLGEEI
jgi:ATP phosphoribosyltransferase